MYHGIESGDRAQVELGAFMAAVNVRQMGSGGLGDVASQLARPAWHVRRSHLAGDVLEKAVGSIVPGGDLAVRGGREIAGVAGGFGRHAARAIWELVDDQNLYFVHPSMRPWLRADIEGGDSVPTHHALVPYDSEFAEWQISRHLSESRRNLGIPESGKPNSLLTKVRDWAYGYNLDPENYASWTIRSGAGGRVLGRNGQVLQDGWYMYVVDRNNGVRYLPTQPTPTSNKEFDQYRAHTQLARGENVWGAGAFKIVDGRFLSVNTGSGHYRPTENYLVYTRRVLRTQGFDVERTAFDAFKPTHPWYHPQELVRLGRDLAGATTSGLRRLLGLNVNEKRPVPPAEWQDLMPY